VGLRIVGVSVREKVWLENILSQLAQAIFEPNLFPYKYSNILKTSHSSYPPAYKDGTECSETSAGSGYFRAKHFTYKYSNILRPSHSSYPAAYEDETECSETSAYKIQTPGNYPEESIQHLFA
jgi:hypothetical protein